MAVHERAVKEDARVPKGRTQVALGPRPGEAAHGHHAFPDPLTALAALGPGQVAVVTFPPHEREALNQWRAGLWGAANQLRREAPERGLLCTTVREEPAGLSLYFWYSADGEEGPAEDQGVGAFLHGYSVAEAAQVLGVSEKTIRRHIKAGRFSATLFNGPRGPEYRIESLELRVASAGAALLEEATAPGDTAGATADSFPAVGQAQELALAGLEGAATALLADLQVQLAAKERRIEELQQEKVQMAGKVGVLLERARHLEEQLKLLPPPRPKRSWWRRLLFRG
ncbi:MAG: DNA-binding protein [Dehalococcoidia bacterium]|nr:DNA-binding protein [Dehalococcoidia bacterium]